MNKLENINIVSTGAIITPRELKEQYPVTKDAAACVLNARKVIVDILEGRDKRLLLIVGPCSIHDTRAALEYASHLNKLSKEVGRTIFIVMRTYFEKPRTTIGWKGFINDPFLDGSCDVSAGLRGARELLVKINQMGVPSATEFLDPVTPQYLADLISWTAIGARTTESQTHREMASGLSMPVGFKNGTDGSVKTAVNAMIAARRAQSFIGIDEDGKVSLVRTRGNEYGHIVLRGGGGKQNYHTKDILGTKKLLHNHGLREVVLIDCSHENSKKDYKLQPNVFRYVLEQRVKRVAPVIGLMLESNLEAGSQPIPKDLKQLKYGVSVTDSCIDWKTTEESIRTACKIFSNS